MEYVAHSRNSKGQVHFLKTHLVETADLMKTFTDNAFYVKLFSQAALLHDFGKYPPEFQDYIINGGRRGSVPHAFLGASFARCINQVEIAFAVHGHHKGLPNMSDLKVNTIAPKEWNTQKYKEITKIFLEDIGRSEPDFCPEKSTFSKLQQEVFIRYLFSALTDADWLSTEKHFNETIFFARKPMPLDCDYLIELLEKDISSKNKLGDINKLRNEVREYALSKADMPTGFYSLGLPTGLGKTLVSVSWALRHAQKNNLKRIIIVVPYLTITDQTSKILRKLFGRQWILEHYSSYNEEESNDKEKSGEPHIKKLATENWDYPIIITTTVQFFDSIFSNKPKRCRKIHNIAESVVIFDEVQTLPMAFLEPILSVLQDMQSTMRTSFFFCTATQPAFEKRTNFSKGIDNIISLVSDPKNIFKQTKRVIYKPVLNFEPVSIKTLIEQMDNNDSTLAVFNTKQNALNAFLEAKQSNKWNKCYHLSKAMCSKHRKKIIDDIRDDLSKNENIFVASTQLIEAGVGFDFPCVYREIAPLESIIQSAGRCNREGKLNEQGRYGNVYIFRLENGKFPDRLYGTLSLHTMTLLQQDIDKLHDYDFFTSYYADIVKLFVDTDEKNINEARESLKFETVAGAFHMIEDASVSVFIANYNKATLKFLDRIKHKEFLSRADYRYMSQYSVQVYCNFLDKTRGQWTHEKEKGYFVWHGSYSEDTGICAEPELTDDVQ